MKKYIVTKAWSTSNWGNIPGFRLLLPGDILYAEYVDVFTIPMSKTYRVFDPDTRQAIGTVDDITLFAEEHLI